MPSAFQKNLLKRQKASKPKRGRPKKKVEPVEEVVEETTTE